MQLPAQYYAHVLEALRKNPGCPVCGEGKTMTTYQIAASIQRSPEHTLDALTAANAEGAVEWVPDHNDPSHGQRAGRWRLTRIPEPENMSQARALVREVAEAHGVAEGVLYGVYIRDWQRVGARRCAMRRLRDELHMTYKEIGKLFGGLDHHTVIYHVQRSRAEGTS